MSIGRAAIFLGWVVGAIIVSSSASAADTITGGLYITGYPTNYYNPANGFVPAGYANSTTTMVPIGSGVEFGFNDGGNVITADFTPTMLTLGNLTGPNASGPENSLVEIFTGSNVNQFSALSLTSSTFTGLTYSVSGSTLTVNIPSFTAGPNQLFNAKFSTVAGAPEPATWAMMLVGLGAMGASMRHRRRSRSAPYA